MSWMLSVWAAALLALCKGQNTVHEGSSLSALGYHLCIHNETRWASFLVMHKVPYTVSKPCGGWLLWKTCNATLYKMVPKTENRTVIMQVTKCCNGYVQAGRYCAIPVSRSGGLAAKPGSCPTVDGLHPGSEECEWDMDCPGWQKCCQGPDESSCSHPARSANYSNNRGNRFNATVTVKVDYQQLMSLQEGLLNHTRVLRAMVSGALQFDDVLVHYLSSWPVHPYRTATSLLIDLNETLSLDDVTSKLHLLLKHIQEVSSVTLIQEASSVLHIRNNKSFCEQFYQSLSPEMKALVDSGEVRIEITSISQGSVVVNLTFIVIRPSSSHDISDVSVALINSLTNSSRYTVDRNRTNIRDFDECTSDDNDCSQWANCTNTWGSYSCVCKDGFTDNNPERPGRDCRAALEPMTSSASPAVSLTSGSMTSSTSTSPTSSALIATGPITATEPVTAAITTTVPIPTPVTADTSTMALDITTPTTTTIPSMTTSTTGNTITQTTTVSAPTTTTSPLTTTDLTTTIIPFTTATTVGNTITPTITVSAPTTTPPSLTTPNPTAATTPSTTVTTPSVTAAPTTTTVPVTSITSPSTPATTTISPAPVPTTTAALGNIFMSGAISVQCSVADITVTVARDFLHQANIRENALYLGLVECGVKGANATHVRLTVAWDECSTMLMQNETYYTASVTLFNSMASFTSSSGTVEVPRIRLEVPVVCTYLRSQLISANFNSMGYDLIQDIIMGLGSFHVMVQLMNGTVPLPYNYTMSRDEAVVVQVRLNTSSEQIKVVINRCWATPIPNPAASYSNTFLENSCPMNMYTTVLVNGNSTTSRVSVQIFSFINLDVVYLHCQVHICLQVGSDSCVPDCQSRTSRSAKTIGSDICSGGPLNRLFHFDTEQELDPAYIAGFACLGVGLSLILLGALVCIFYYQRNRIGHYNFAAKPKQENFTYLVFNA